MVSSLPIPAFAWLKYERADGSEWLALVFKTPDGWELKLGQPKNLLPGGNFTHGKALEKFVRKKAATLESKGAKKVSDTLSKIRNVSPWSLVPDCYEPAEGLALMGRGLPACVACPYRSQCGEPSTQPKSEHAQESEEVFRARLQAKLKSQWGNDNDG